MCENEKELLIKAKIGDERSFEMLMQANYQKIYNLAFRLLGNREDAYELTQDTFIRGWRSIKKFRGESSFYTYLYRICLNQGLSFLKKRKKVIPRKEAVVLSGKDPIENYREEILKKEIEDALSRLSPQEKVVFIMRQYEGVKIKEIAQFLNLKEGTVKSTYFHAVEKMRNFLKRWL